MMAKEYNETTNKLTNKDLKKFGFKVDVLPDRIYL